MPVHVKAPMKRRDNSNKNVSDTTAKVVVERSNKAAASRDLWRGLMRFNRQQAGSIRYKRTVLTLRDGKRRLLGGLILESYWRESYVELLWVAARARSAGLGRKLVQEAER